MRRSRYRKVQEAERNLEEVEGSWKRSKKLKTDKGRRKLKGAERGRGSRRRHEKGVSGAFANSSRILQFSFSFQKSMNEKAALPVLVSIGWLSSKLMLSKSVCTASITVVWLWFGLITRRSLASQSAAIVRSDTLFFSCPQLCVNKKVQQNGMKSNPKDRQT